MIAIELNPPFKKKTRLDATEKDLAAKMKESAHLKRAGMTRWYIDQLADHLSAQEREQAAKARQEASDKAVADEIAARREKMTGAQSS